MASQYHYVVTSQQPTVVSHSLVANFTSSEDKNLVIAKINRLEIHSIASSKASAGPSDGTEAIAVSEVLAPLFDLPIYGRIAALTKVRLAGDSVDTILLTTERYQLVALQFDSVARSIKTVASGDLRDRLGRPIDQGQLVTVDPLNRAVAFLFYDGLLKVLMLDKGFREKAFNVRLEPMLVRDITFVHPQITGHGSASIVGPPTLAVLYEDEHAKGQPCVQFYELDAKEKVLRAVGAKAISDLDVTSTLLTPVPDTSGGGVLITGSLSIRHIPLPGPAALPPRTIDSTGIPSCIPKLIARVNASTYIMADSMGGLSMFVLKMDAAAARPKLASISYTPLGTSVLASTLAYLDAGLVFIGSGAGDSQLLRLRATASSAPALDAVTVFPCLGPIVDLCVMDLERQGQGQVISACGVGKDGSIRVVRNGIGIEEQAHVELPGITGIWSLRDETAAIHDRYLVQSFAHETRILAISEEAMEEVEDAPGLSLTSQSLFCGNLLDDLVVQVTPTEARLFRPSNGFELVASWTASSLPSIDAHARITVAASYGPHLLLAIAGGHIVHLRVETTGTFTLGASTTMPHEIACLSVHSATTQERLPSGVLFVGVGLWTDISVRLLRLAFSDHETSLEEVAKQHLGGEIQSRSILAVTLEGIHYLLVGMGDGHLFTFRMKLNAGKASAELLDKRSVALGTQPITLSTFATKGTINVFAACDRPTVLYSSSRKLLFSNVNQPQVTYMSPFHSQSFPDCLALASESGLLIGTVDDIQKLHIRTIPLGEQPRRVCHHQSSKSVVVAVEAAFPAVVPGESGAALPSQAVMLEKCFLRLLDDSTFDTVASYALNNHEMTVALATYKLGGTADTADASSATEPDGPEYIVVGTAYVLEDEEEPSSGRLLVLQVKSDITGRSFEVVAEREVRGGVFSLGLLASGLIVAGVNSRVQVYNFVDAGAADASASSASKSLVPLCGFGGATLALYLDTKGDFILVGDLMKSISLLRYKVSDSSLEEVAAEPSCNWMTAVAMLDDSNFIGAEHHYNLFAATRRNAATASEFRTFLEATGEFYLGDMVNRFAAGSLVMLPMEDAPSVRAEDDDIDLLPSAGSAKRQKRTVGAEADGSADAALSTKAKASNTIKPRLIFGTVGGSIGAILTINASLYKFLATVQRAINLTIPGVGGLSHAMYRSWYSDRKVPNTLPIGATQPVTRGFIDGDLIETLLDAEKDVQIKVVAAMNGLRGECVVEDIEAVMHPDGSRSTEALLEEVVKVVEDLARLH